MVQKVFLLIPAILFSFCSCSKKEHDTTMKALWIEEAFTTLRSGKYPRIKAIAWWHENFDGTQLRIDSSPESLEAYRCGVSDSLFITKPLFSEGHLVPSDKSIYHGAFPDLGGTEDQVTRKRIEDFERLAGKRIVWAYFSNNWTEGIRFPTREVATLRDMGRIPFIRLMARSRFEEGGPDEKYSLQRILEGDFDDAFNAWFREAASTGIPLLVEFGTEVNGDWFPWNGRYNGGGTTTGYGDPAVPDGPERFRDAYRHLVTLSRKNGATNITWFFHVDAYSQPQMEWNDLEQYYPGDDYIDWLGISVYGPQEKNEPYHSFEEILEDVYDRITALSNKPLAVLEFGITEL